MIFYIILLTIWIITYKILVTWTGIWKDYIFPSPTTVLKSLIELFKTGALIQSVLVSLRRLLLGYIIALLIGGLIGVLIIVGPLSKPLKGFSSAIQTLPSVCWLPFSILFFGMDEKSILFVVVIGTVFSVATAIDNGIKSVNPIYFKVGETLGLTGVSLYSKVIIKAAIPTIITGLKNSWNLAWRALLAAEVLYATIGIGQILTAGRTMGDISQIVAVMIILIVIGVTLNNLIFEKIEYVVYKRYGLIYKEDK